MPAARSPSADAARHDARVSPLLLDWYDRHARELPWRVPPGRLQVRADPYRVWLSEIMLQQTTVATVRGRFDPFIQRFPDVNALAAASEAEVLHAWQGLGYYRRARALHACAKTVVGRHAGHLPRDLDALLALPGVGAYTAKAVAAIRGLVPGHALLGLLSFVPGGRHISCSTTIIRLSLDPLDTRKAGESQDPDQDAPTKAR